MIRNRHLGDTKLASQPIVLGRTFVAVKLLSLMFLAVLSACESDTAKYERLYNDLLAAGLPISNAEYARAHGLPLCPELVKLPTNAYINACDKQLAGYEADLALKQRAFNKFMGR